MDSEITKSVDKYLILKEGIQSSGFSWYESQGSVGTTLKQALRNGSIGLFCVECIVTTPEINAQGIGKSPLSNQDEVLANTLILYHQEKVAHLIKLFQDNGVQPYLYCSLCDDDFLHWSAAPWDLQNSQVKETIEKQKDWITETLPSRIGLNPQQILVKGWSEIETEFPDLLQIRKNIEIGLERIVRTDHKFGNSAEVLQRYQNFVDWRQQLATTDGFSFDSQYILSQALQELTCFVSQLQGLPLIMRSFFGSIPLMYLNTFPGFESQDFACAQIGKQLGLTDCKNYPMITPSVKEKQISIPMVCGDLNKWRKKKYG